MQASNSNYTAFDPANTVRSTEWFRTHEFKKKTAGNKITLVVERTLHAPKARLGYFTTLAGAFAARWGAQPDFYKESEAINDIAEQELRNADAPIKGNKTEALNERIERLENIAANLRNHEVEVEEHNKGLYFPRGTYVTTVCPDHTALISRVGQKIDRLRNQLAELSPDFQAARKATADCKRKFEELRALKVIDASFIESEYPICRQFIMAAPQSDQQKLEEELNSIINERFFSGLNALLSSEQPVIPSSLVAACEILGFDRQWIETHQKAIKDRFSQSMQLWLAHHPDWKALSPAEIVKTLQKLIGEAAVEKMDIPPEAKEDAALFLATMRKLEIGFDRRLKEAASFYQLSPENSSKITYSGLLKTVLQIKAIDPMDLKDPALIKKALEHLAYVLGLLNSDVEEGFIQEQVSAVAKAQTAAVRTAEAAKPAEKKTIEAEKKLDFENSMALLDARLTDGYLPCNASFILTNLPLYEERLQKLPLASQKELRERLYEIINRHFIDYASHALLDPEIDVPRSMKLFFRGLKVNFSKTETEAGKQAFNDKIKGWMLKSGGEWSVMDPRALVRQFQEWMIDEALIRGKIPDNLKEEVKETLLLIRQTELAASRKTMALWETEKKSLLESLPESLKNDPIARRQIFEFDPNPDFGDLVYDSFNGLKIDLMQSDPDQFIQNLRECKEKFLEDSAGLDQAIQTNFEQKLDLLKHRVIASSFDLDKWLKKNHGRQLFAYSQSLDGEDFVFQRGICAGINFRWIFNLLERDLPNIVSFHDLEELELHSASEITGKFHRGNFRQKHQEAGSATLLSDRVRQARMSVVSKLDWKTSEEVDASGKIKLTAKKITYQEALYEGTKYTPDTIYSAEKKLLAADLFSSLIGREGNHPFLRKSKGIVQVDVYSIAGKDGVKQASAHALGLQIDENKQVFRFWDVNKGMWEFETLKDLESAFKEYVELVYHDMKYVQCYQPLKK